MSLQVLGLHISDFTLPDVNLLGEHADAAELGRMLQLILGCAVNCEQKQGGCVRCLGHTPWITGQRSGDAFCLCKCVIVLLCCVEYIQTIMMMEESVQHVVMTAIQEVR